MAPNKTSTKRVAESKISCNKKAKVDPQFDPLFDIVKRAELPEAAKEMLLAVIPGSFGVPQDLRHEAQEAVVGWVATVIDESKAKMAASIEKQKTDVDEAESKKDVLAQAVKEAEAQFATALEKSLEKEQLLLVASRVAGEKKVLLEAAKTKQAEGDQSITALQCEKDKTEALVSTEFKFLVEAEEREEADVKKSIEAMQPISSTLDESLGSTFVTACEKAPSTRGTFDKMVLEQAMEHFKESIAKFEQGIIDAGPGKAERAAVVEDANQEFERAKDEEIKVKEQAALASEAKIAAVRELGSKKDDLQSFAIEHDKATKALQEDIDTLKQFETYNIACFTLLKDKRTDVVEDTTKMIEAPAQVDGAAPVEVAGA